MTLQLCIQYPNGAERVLKRYLHRDTAVRCIDAIYSQGYPLHIAYVIRQAQVA
jgi:hypothetical protein